MSPILFYGVPEGCSFGSIVALEWLGEPYRLCRIQMPQEVGNERYGAVNAVRETPTLLTADGALISESVAILNHLATRGMARGLGFAQGDPAFDRFNQTLAFLNTSLFSAFSPLWYAVEHDIDGTTEAALRAYGAHQVARAHGHIEAMLADRDWLAGDKPGLVDAYFAGVARWNDYHKVVDRAGYPRLARLYQRLQEDQAVRFAHAIEEERAAQSAGGFHGHVSLDEALGLAKAA